LRTSKALIHYAKNKNLNFSQAIEKELALVAELRKEKYEDVLKSLKNVEFIEGKAKFVGENEVEVWGNRFQGEKFIIANGSTANVPYIEGIKEVGYLTHITALSNKNLPQSIAIIGAGPLGLEFSQIYSRFGSKSNYFRKRKFYFPTRRKRTNAKIKRNFRKRRN
jgi:mercuric reductase